MASFSGVYMKPSSPTVRASPLARAVFYPHFTWEFIWRASSGKRARQLDVSYNLGGGDSHRLGYGMCHFLGYFFGWKINFWVYFIACNKFLGQDFSLE